MAETVEIGAIGYSTDTSRDLARITSIQLDRRYTIFSDGVIGVWYWDSSTTAPKLLQDLVPYLPDNSGSTDTSGNESKALNACPYVIPGDFLTWYRGRLWLADCDRSRVRYSGTRTDLALREGAQDSHGNYAPIKPWQLWNQNMDLSRYNAGYGGSVIVGDVTQRITGMVGVENGLLVFKEKSIYIWNYPESAAPHEASGGASIKIFADNLGAIGQDSIIQMGDDVVFLSRDSRGALAIYSFVGGELKDISRQIYSDLQNCKWETIKPKLQVLGDYLYVAYDNGDSECRIRHGYDFARGCWFDITSPRVNVMEPSLLAGKMLIGTDAGKMLVYPSPDYQDHDIDKTATVKVKIPWLVRTKRFDFGDPLTDKKFRKVWAGVETDGALDIFVNLLYNDEHTSVHEPIYTEVDSCGNEPSYEWEFQEDETISLVQGVNNIQETTTKRAKNMVVEIAGNSDKRLNIHSIKVGARPRSQK